LHIPSKKTIFDLGTMIRKGSKNLFEYKCV